MLNSPGSQSLTLWLPKCYQDLNSLPPENVLYQPELGGSKVVRTAPGVVIKYRGDLAEEVLCQSFVQGKLSVRVPRVLHHPGDPYVRKLWDPRTEPLPGVWYICMDELPGIPLSKVIDTFTHQQLDHVSSQLKAILGELHSVKSNTLGSVSGGPFRNPYFFPRVLEPRGSWLTVSEFIDHFRQLLLIFGTEQYAKELLSEFPLDAPIHFAHGDLVPRNILVDGSTMTGIVDWSTAGFYPEFWEYCRMHDQSSKSPGWDYVLASIFPMPRREREIAALHRLMGTLLYNL